MEGGEYPLLIVILLLIVIKKRSIMSTIRITITSILHHPAGPERFVAPWAKTDDTKVVRSEGAVQTEPDPPENRIGGSGSVPTKAS